MDLRFFFFFLRIAVFHQKVDDNELHEPDGKFMVWLVSTKLWVQITCQTFTQNLDW